HQARHLHLSLHGASLYDRQDRGAIGLAPGPLSPSLAGSEGEEAQVSFSIEAALSPYWAPWMRSSPRTGCASCGAAGPRARASASRRGGRPSPSSSTVLRCCCSFLACPRSSSQPPIRRCRYPSTSSCSVPRVNLPPIDRQNGPRRRHRRVRGCSRSL